MHNFTAGNVAIRRKVKGGLNWAAEDRISVHFVLDGVNMSDVIEKRLYNLNKSTTGSELRWLYRNRDNPAVQDVVQFWKDGHRVNPPWEDDKKLWSQYLPKSSDKALSETDRALNVSQLHASDGTDPVNAAAKVNRPGSGTADELIDLLRSVF
ncbi:hypothetical protein Brsp01_50520 [Brucella sp. NBRC 12950]|nr:hypothetical protein Brsp01_50520 [Brucella sp. NBRC 12950]